jgi:hypothetical protein
MLVRWSRLAWVAGFAFAPGCLETVTVNELICADNSQCKEAAGSICVAADGEPTGLCAMPDPTCVSGYRYDTSAGALAWACADGAYGVASAPVPDIDGSPPCPVGSCGGGQVCSRLFTCEDPSQLQTITVTWTLGGQSAGATSCAGIDHLLVAFGTAADAAGDLGGVGPVECEGGLLRMDGIPPAVRDVEVIAQSAHNLTLATVTAPVGGPPASATAVVTLP